MRRAWAALPDVVQALHEHRGLARTDDFSFAEQSGRIRALQGHVPRAVIPLLTAILIRNHGAHVGLYTLDTEELRDLEWQVLTAVVLSWSALHTATN